MNLEALDNAFDNIVRATPLPSVAEEGIIGVKNFFKDEENREKICDFFNNIFNKNGKILENIWNVKETIKEKGIKEGISEAIDIVVDNAKSSKNISTLTAKTIKNSKDVIVDNILNKDKENFEKQAKILEKVNDKYAKWEEMIENNKIKEANRLGEEIKKECKKLLPTIELINKINNIDNTTTLLNTKNSITQLENEILRKIS